MSFGLMSIGSLSILSSNTFALEEAGGCLVLSKAGTQILISDQYIKLKNFPHYPDQLISFSVLGEVLRSLAPQEIEQMVELFQNTADKRAYQFLGWCCHVYRIEENAELSFTYFKKYFDAGGRGHASLHELAQAYVANNQFKEARNCLLYQAKFEVRLKKHVPDTYLQFLYNYVTLKGKNKGIEVKERQNFWKKKPSPERLYNFSKEYLKFFSQNSLSKVKRRFYQIEDFLRDSAAVRNLKIDELCVVLYWQKRSLYSLTSGDRSTPLKDWIQDWEQEEKIEKEGIFNRQLQKRLALEHLKQNIASLNAAASERCSCKKNRVKRVHFEDLSVPIREQV